MVSPRTRYCLHTSPPDFCSCPDFIGARQSHTPPRHCFGWFPRFARNQPRNDPELRKGRREEKESGSHLYICSAEHRENYRNLLTHTLDHPPYIILALRQRFLLKLFNRYYSDGQYYITIQETVNSFCAVSKIILPPSNSLPRREGELQGLLQLIIPTHHTLLSL
jgi:hypothetical protein